MFISYFFHHVNWLALAVCGIMYFALGALWFSPVLFAKTWVKEHNISMDNEEAKKRLPLIMITTLVLNFLIVLALAMVVLVFQSNTALNGAKIGALLGGGFVVTIMGMTYMYGGKSIKIWLIDSGYHVVAITASAVILSVWH